MTLLVCCLLAYYILRSYSCTQHSYNVLCIGHRQCQNCVFLASSLIFIIGWKLMAAGFNCQNDALLLWDSVTYWAVFIYYQNAALLCSPFMRFRCSYDGFHEGSWWVPEGFWGLLEICYCRWNSRVGFPDRCLDKISGSNLHVKHKYFLPMYWLIWPCINYHHLLLVLITLGCFLWKGQINGLNSNIFVSGIFIATWRVCFGCHKIVLGLSYLTLYCMSWTYKYLVVPESNHCDKELVVQLDCSDDCPEGTC